MAVQKYSLKPAGWADGRLNRKINAWLKELRIQLPYEEDFSLLSIRTKAHMVHNLEKPLQITSSDVASAARTFVNTYDAQYSEGAYPDEEPEMAINDATLFRIFKHILMTQVAFHEAPAPSASAFADRCLL